MSSWLKIDSDMVYSYLFYVVLGLFLFPFFQYKLNLDAISYISIAEKYGVGNIPDAINGYWGPLLSWLMTPALFLGLDAVWSAKCLLLIIGAITLFQVRTLVDILGIKDIFRKVLLLISALLILNYALTLITPDLLLSLIHI